MLGTIGATCAFPFAGDELYGQHVHPAGLQAPASAPYSPAFFTPADYATLERLTDLIIPPTDTPGAAGAGVPEYIDRVVSLNPEHQPLVRTGLAWLAREAKARFTRDFLALAEAEQIALLQPLSDEVDRERQAVQRARFRAEAQGRAVYYVPTTDKTPPVRQAPAPGGAAGSLPADPRLGPEFFRLVKNLTADGYYTSRVGLIEELGYTGNTVLASFPSCTVPEQ